MATFPSPFPSKPSFNHAPLATRPGVHRSRSEAFIRNRTSLIVIGTLLTLAPASTQAQYPLPPAPVQPAPPDSQEEARPPALVEAAEATYPEEALAQRLEAIVVLSLTIDVEGHVVSAEVSEPAGHGFDEAARDAALRFRFSPAWRAGQPVAARIRYPYRFQLAPEAAPIATEPPSTTAPPAPLEPAAPPPVAVPTSPAPAPQPISVSVHGAATAAQQLQQSAEAVNVVETRKAQQQSADLGEVLARSQGVAVRRDGGLGSEARFSLNGLYDDQIRFFLDGVPLDLAGYPFGIANVPVNLVERVEVYRGVVPIRFGADALGGAVNLVSDQSFRTHLDASYQVGSFGTHRVTLDGRYRHAPSGFVLGGAAFFDRAKNDYEVDVEVPDDRGRLSPATVPRFHDGYRAYGATLEAGIVERRWARKLLLQGFASTYEKELQNNLVMTVPYGEPTYGESVVGGTARYEVALRTNLELELLANSTHRVVTFADKGEWVYDWFGKRIRARRVPGEIQSKATDQIAWQDSAFGRATVKWAIAPAHIARLSASPAFATRTGDERLQADPTARDPLTAKRDLLTFVSGLEYELSLFSERLSNIAFVKDYVYRAASEEPLPGGIFRERETKRHSQGIGDALRFRFTSWLYAKASYEYATRLPRPDEVFGNGGLVLSNLDLEPEVSHNANVGPRVELRRTPVGEFTVDLNGFLRDSDRLIVLLGNDRFFTYQNVYKARGLGLENALAWTSPGRFLSLDGTFTWQSVVNASDEGTFKDFKGDRIPNRPYMFGSWGARLRFANLPGGDDTVEPFYSGRYVNEFFRGWESQGLREFKQVVDSQVTHNAGVSYTLSRDYGRATATCEIDNLTNAKVYDFFGVQRPGRAFYAKLTGDI